MSYPKTSGRLGTGLNQSSPPKYKILALEAEPGKGRDGGQLPTSPLLGQDLEVLTWLWVIVVPG
ncbi:unnamed protein product [Penicillium camemberti]|uniref:Str. FM013 n=1 Tax=Penicillium camemberti (strain FM 013) TaxID=1429867 RepID=A0A0G4P327_PENC3|nr:unnamed protein product [Penicillium camemberti]